MTGVAVEINVCEDESVTVVFTVSQIPWDLYFLYHLAFPKASIKVSGADFEVKPV